MHPSTSSSGGTAGSAQQKIEMIKQYYNQLSTNIRAVAGQLNQPNLPPARRTALQAQYDRLQASMSELTDKVLKPLMMSNTATQQHLPQTHLQAAQQPKGGGGSSPMKQHAGLQRKHVGGLTTPSSSVATGFQAVQQQQYLFQQRMMALNQAPQQAVGTLLPAAVGTTASSSLMQQQQQLGGIVGMKRALLTPPVNKIKTLLEPQPTVLYHDIEGMLTGGVEEPQQPIAALYSGGLTAVKPSPPSSSTNIAYVDPDKMVDWVVLDSMIDRVCEEACKAALARASSDRQINAKDLAFALKRIYPGTLLKPIRGGSGMDAGKLPVKRLSANHPHQLRLAQIKKLQTRQSHAHQQTQQAGSSSFHLQQPKPRID